jgi:hypothetical protein
VKNNIIRDVSIYYVLYILEHQPPDSAVVNLSVGRAFKGAEEAAAELALGGRKASSDH